MKEPTYTDWCVNNKTPCKVSIYYQKHKSLCKQKAFKFAYHLDAELVKWRRIHSNLLNGVDGIPPPQHSRHKEIFVSTTEILCLL